MSTVDLALQHRRATRHLAAALGAALTPGDLVLLEGDLGAGKTFLVRGIARALGVPSHVRITSPTFALVHEHAARIPIVHADLYRLSEPDELLELGLAERVGSDAVVLVEWGERFAEAFGDDGLLVRLAWSDTGRSARLTARGPRGAALLARASADPHFGRLR